MDIYFVCSYEPSSYAYSAHRVYDLFQQHFQNRGDGHTHISLNMVYIGGNSATAPLYPSSSSSYNVCGLFDIHDAPNNVVILFDYYTGTRFQKECNVHHCTIVIWWYSLTNALLNQTLSNIDDPSFVHVFHSFGVYSNVLPYLEKRQATCFLTDDSFLTMQGPPPPSLETPRKDIVCVYEDDAWAAQVLEEAGIDHCFVGKNDTIESEEPLRYCKVFVDLRKHVLKSLGCRLACLHGCVVITNRAGVAAYWEDIPIHEKVSSPTEVPKLVNRVFESYKEFRERQSYYYQTLQRETQVGLDNVRTFISTIAKPMHRGLEFIRHADHRIIMDTFLHHVECLQKMDPANTSAITLPAHLSCEGHQKNVLTIGKGARDILQLGFTDGVSTLLWLLANAHSKILCVCSTETNQILRERYHYLDTMFPRRLELLVGVSEVVLRKYHEITDTVFDVVHFQSCNDDCTSLYNQFEGAKPLAKDVIVCDVETEDGGSRRQLLQSWTESQSQSLERMTMFPAPYQMYYRRRV